MTRPILPFLVSLAFVLPTASVDPPEATMPSQDPTLEPAGLATGDFDGDGLDDVVVGYATSEGGLLVLYPANPVSIFPNSAVAATLRPDVAGPDVPLLPPREIVRLPDSPDLLAVGDFDADGRREIVAAEIGRRRLSWIPGDGSGGVREISTIELPGRARALDAGEFHHPDGATDLAVGVTSGEQSSLLIFSDALRGLDAPPRVVPLPGEPSRIELGRFGDGLSNGAAVRAGGEEFVVSEQGPSLRLLRSEQAVLDDRDGPVMERRIRLNGDSIDDLVFLEKGRLAPVVVETAPLAVFTVDSTADTSDAVPGDGVCADSFIVPRCTLRAALEEAGAGGGPHTIEFDLGAGTPTIAVGSPLPGLSGVTVDGATGGATRVEILGSSGTGLSMGFNNLVRSIVINGFGTAVDMPGVFGNRLEDCYIGLNLAGGTAGAGNSRGIDVTQFASSNTIGGTTVAQRNVISNQLLDGVYLAVETASNEILGNYIGTDPTGTLARPNGRHGINSEGDSSDAFGAASATPGEPPGNLISGNDGSGIVAWGAPFGFIRSNLIGTDAKGEVALPNQVGVRIVDGFDGLLVGNVISGNDDDGAQVCARGGLAFPSGVEGNLIGTDIAGSSPLPNRGDGVEITCSSTEIGGLTGATSGGCTGDCNVIAFNDGAGVRVQVTDDRSAIVGNSIHDNDGLGIDLDPAGPTPNDPLDADTGANQQQNHPMLTFADFDGFDTTIAGTLHSTPATTFSIDVYGNAVDEPQDAEGGLWFGRTTVTTDTSGDGAFALVVPGYTGFPTATATDPADNTSELSPGYSNPGEAGEDDDLRASKGPGSAVGVTWLPACGASDHAIYLGSAGPDAMTGPPDWTDAFCGLGDSGAASFDPGDPNPGRFFHFVVIGQAVASEGSYGRDSSDVERPEAAGVGACDLPQTQTIVCP